MTQENKNEWISTKNQLPAEGQEVTALLNHGQISQVVKDKHYAGGWKQVNCMGWESVSHYSNTITHWRPEIFVRPNKTGPDDAPWMALK